MNLSDETLKNLVNGYDHIIMAAAWGLFICLLMAGVGVYQKLIEAAITQ